MSCLALKLTCKTRPQWMQMALDNDVKPAEYEAEIARLNVLVETLLRQNEHHRQHLGQIIQSLQRRLPQDWRILWTEAENNFQRQRMQAYTTELPQAGRAIAEGNED